MDFQDVLKKNIQQNGPLTVHHFMQQCVMYYYANHQVFGARGDFITAPEISQMFGEMIGAWCADLWIGMGRPRRFMMVECGPGQGTLMADIVRATKNVPDMHDAMDIAMVENSMGLRQRQLKAMGDWPIIWHSDWAQIEGGIPAIFICNEFLDALPIHQMQFQDAAWKERVVGLDADHKLQFGLSVPTQAVMALKPQNMPPPKDGDICEISASRHAFTEFVAGYLAQNGGAALYIDYGHLQSGYGDTLQAMRDHGFVDVLESAGGADLTSHVDFAALVHESEFLNHYMTTQGAFLKSLGIEARAQMLKEKATPEQAADIDAALHRLCDADQMGELFKVMVVASANLKPAGVEGSEVDS